METVYKDVVESVILSCKTLFSDEGVDEQILEELKQIWEDKIKAVTKDKKIEKPNWNPKPAPAPNAPPKTESAQATTSTPAVAQVTKIIPIQVKLPPSSTQPARRLCINVPASSLQNNKLQKLLTGSIITSALDLPADVATVMLQEHINLNISTLLQVDGTDDSSDTEDDDEESLNEEEDEEEPDIEMQQVEDDPLNSDDDVSEEDLSEMYETDNIIVCQYDKVGRSRNKWRFFLKDGILHTKDGEIAFLRASGEAEW